MAGAMSNSSQHRECQKRECQNYFSDTLYTSSRAVAPMLHAVRTHYGVIFGSLAGWLGVLEPRS